MAALWCPLWVSAQHDCVGCVSHALNPDTFTPAMPIREHPSPTFLSTVPVLEWVEQISLFQFLCVWLDWCFHQQLEGLESLLKP